MQLGVTPVIIAQQIEWVTQSAWRTEREAFTRQMESWRTAWESRDTGRYLAHYARDFRSDGMNIAAWSEHKRRVNAAKTWIKVALTNVSVFRTPGQQDLIAVTFDQDYRSDNLAQQTRKRQYWVMEDGRWKIAYEAPVRSTVLALPESYPGRRRR